MFILMFGPGLGRPFQPGGLVQSMPRSAACGGATPWPTCLLRSWVASEGRWWQISCSVEPPISISTKHRASGAHFLSEVVATLGLLLVIFALARTGRGRSAPAAVGAYIGAAYFFTSSTSFANPAITVGRMFSNTFAGIAPSSVPSFIAAQVVGGVLAIAVINALFPRLTAEEAAEVVVPHPSLLSDDGSPRPGGEADPVEPTSPIMSKESP